MQRKSLFPLLIVLVFTLILFSGTLTGNEFYRYTYQPVRIDCTNAAQHYEDMRQCGFDLIWNSGGNFGNPSLGDYLDKLTDNDMRAILSKGGDDYLLEYYSKGRSHRYQVDWDYDIAVGEELPGWYYFWYGESFSDTTGSRALNVPPGENSWYCEYGTDSPGCFLQGPGETIGGSQSKGGYFSQSPISGDSEVFLSRFRVKANISGLADTDSIFRAQVYQYYNGYTRTVIDTGFVKSDFSSSDWLDLEMIYTMLDTMIVNSNQDTLDMNGAYKTLYKFYWQGNCDFWVDYVEFMDTTRAYHLFYSDAEWSSTWNDIEAELSSLETTYGSDIYAWQLQDEPRRSNWRAHDRLIDSVKVNLQYPAVTTFWQNWNTRRCSVYVDLIRPDLFIIDQYVLKPNDEDKYPQGQAELDSLTNAIEHGYGAAHLVNPAPPFWVTLQGHLWIPGYFDGKTDTTQRDPTVGELRAQAYLALAHGAEGIGFWKYYSSAFSQWNVNYGHGLLDTTFAKNYKWYAVQEINARLDSMESVIADWERYSVMCAAGGALSISPIDDIYYSENTSDDTIEVGKFYDTSSDTFLVIVNRHTDADRHITIETDLTGSNALLDLYTQERFVSSTGNFKSIPFDSGEGRVFKIED